MQTGFVCRPTQCNIQGCSLHDPQMLPCGLNWKSESSRCTNRWLLCRHDSYIREPVTQAVLHDHRTLSGHRLPTKFVNAHKKGFSRWTTSTERLEEIQWTRQSGERLCVVGCCEWICTILGSVQIRCFERWCLEVLRGMGQNDRHR